MIAMLKTIHWPYIDMVVAIIMPCQGILNVLIYGNKLDWIKKGCNSCSRDGCSCFLFGTSNFFASASAWYNSTKWGLSAKFPLDFFLRNTKKEQIQEFHKGEQDITDSGETPGIKNDSTNSGNKPGSSTEEEDGFPKKEMDNDGDSKVAPTTVKAQLDYLLQMPAILEKSEMVEEDVTAELPETTTEGCFEPASATGTKLWSTCISNEVVDA